MAGVLGVRRNIPALAQDPRTGELLVNPAKYSEKIVWLSHQGAYPLVLGAGGSGTISLSPPKDVGNLGDVEVLWLVGDSTANVSVQFTHTAINRRLMNSPVELSLVVGSHWGRPAQLLEPIYVPANTSLDATVTDLSGAGATVHLVAVGRQIVDPIGTGGHSAAEVARLILSRQQQPYWLTFDQGPTVTLAAGVAQTVNFTVPSDADFNTFAIRSRSTALLGSDYTIEFVEGQRRSLMTPRRSLPIELVASQTMTQGGGFGPGGVVYAAGNDSFLPFTHLFSRNSVIQAVLLSAAGTTVHLAFYGQLLYHRPGDPMKTAASHVAG